eukprot:TRINITY_DN9765_c0_g1_i4.p1 TRINITY_DN9765_c0_g1~~TRINITY_DN9765_c0_g1_i4.p1  ORF type:complete len:833 (-),score=170.69 TRINITY_DN9765_c0_g1_i4:4-2235(-)
MTGHNVADRPGYDMHGLPTEKATEKELKINGRDEVLAYGIDKYIEECRHLCIKNMAEMTKTFQYMAVWMDWDHPYMSITRDYMEGEWFLIKEAHKKGRLYPGEKTMTWDAANGTALAKHELEYKKVTDEAIYVRFKVLSGEWTNSYLVIWTTTPWTIPFNLAIMVHTGLTYVQVKVNHHGEDQNWILCKDLVEDFIVKKIGVEKPDIQKEFSGESLKGLAYQHIFEDITDVYKKLKKEMPKVHTVVAANEFVNTHTGTGLVHCAPGCGPEDYEVGYRNGIRPFNTVDVVGVFRDFSPFTGLLARKNDPDFINFIDKSKGLVYKHQYEHEYPHGDRSKEGVIYRTTKQWFFKVEDLKDKLVEQNDKIKWVPDSAGNAFKSWLKNLRDNSISKQRFWGTPVPVWENVDDPSDYLVIGSVKELVEVAGLKEEPKDIHIPTVDKIVFKRISSKDGKEHEYRRVPDVLDVWVDAGTASWNSLEFPLLKDKAFLDKWYPIDFIVEGRDQIRGWFNLLHIASNLAFDGPAFKNVYMHGFVQDSMGRKMSKSIGNYILPSEVINAFGVDCMRYYFIGAANPGLDMNYNPNSIKAVRKNLNIFWNLFSYLKATADATEVETLPVSQLVKDKKLDMEEEYVLSKLHSTLKKVNASLDGFRFGEVPPLIEDFLLNTISHTYLQLVWEKASGDSEDGKIAVVSVVLESLIFGATLLAPLVPIFAEKVYQNMKATFPSSPLCKDCLLYTSPSPRDS